MISLQKNRLIQMLYVAVLCLLVSCGGQNSEGGSAASEGALDNDVVDEAEGDSNPAESVSSALALGTSVNVLLIVGDDIGVDIISGYQEQPNYSAQTPTLDSLSKEGVLFRNVWANPMCSPSRAGLLTGRYAIRHGVTSPGSENSALDHSETTLPEMLSEANIKSALFGKWHLGRGLGNYPTEHGFDYYSGSISNIDDYFNWVKTTIAFPGAEAEEIDESGYATEVVAKEAALWISEQTSPWFVQVSFNAPHSPYHVPPSYAYSSDYHLEGEEGDMCTSSILNDDAASCYRAAAEAMDFYIEQLLSTISASVLSDTVIIFVGDNGTPGGVVIEESHLPFSQDHGKRTMYEGGVNVPMIIWGGENTGIDASEVQALVSIQDVYSTVLALVGLPQPSGVNIDGFSLMAYLDNESSVSLRRQTQYSELKNIEDDLDRWAISNGDVKYINNEGMEECYQLSVDPSESANLYFSSNEVAELCDQLILMRPLAD
ncbi:sulfatase-like hydrolase/transferase [Agaribacterium sp. ZY112]|uniref:sulfatase-like hydrolase/transferase n=1 Tax=Agaribacterium sp. ZY112 TaxID=3233574 RepID=UPI003523CC0C